MVSLEDDSRFDRSTRWPGVVEARLGDGWRVVEEGLPGRTTVHDDPIEGFHKNGQRYLQACLESHKPLDAIVLMLGTNDLKARFNLPASDIAAGAGVLLGIIRVTLGTVKLLLVCPPPIEETELLGEMFAGGRARSLSLPSHYRSIARSMDAEFFDAGSVIKSSPVDGIHFDAPSHLQLGTAIAEKLRRLVEPPA